MTVDWLFEVDADPGFALAEDSPFCLNSYLCSSNLFDWLKLNETK